MSIPSQDDRIEIWRYTYARSSLVEAREAANLLATHPEFPNEIKQAIVYQIVISYARPFTKSQVTDSKRITPLAGEVVPAEFRQLHDEYLQMRDRTIGHKDAVAFPAAPLNKVIVLVDDTGFELQTVSAFTMLDTGLQQTISLCDRLIEHCVSKVQAYCHHFDGIAKGTYLLRTDGNPTEWLSRKIE